MVAAVGFGWTAGIARLVDGGAPATDAGQGANSRRRILVCAGAPKRNGGSSSETCLLARMHNGCLHMRRTHRDCPSECNKSRYSGVGSIPYDGPCFSVWTRVVAADFA